MIFSVLIHNVAVDARLAVGGDEQRTRLARKSGERVVGICVIDDVRSVAVFHRPVYHVFVSLVIIDGLRCPHTLQIVLSFVGLLYVNDGVRPVDEVFRLEQNHGAVGVPSVGRHHVGGHHVERMTVLAAQDVRVAHSACGADDLRVDHRAAAVELVPRQSVVAKGEADGLLAYVVACEINKKIAGHILFLNGCRACGGRCQRDDGRNHDEYFFSYHMLFLVVSVSCMAACVRPYAFVNIRICGSPWSVRRRPARWRADTPARRWSVRHPCR